MRGKARRAATVAVSLVAGGVLLANGLTGCTSLAGQAVMGSVDFCFLFDCTNGILGGLIDPCSPIFSRPGTPGFIAADPADQTNTDFTNGRDLFTDCPNTTAP